MTDQTKPSIVLDHGTLTTRAGLSDLDDPILLPSETKSLKRPIAAGVINDFTAMEELWHEIFDVLNVKPSNHRVLISEPVGNNQKNRENVSEIMFETYKVPAMYLVATPVLALFNSGRTGGIVYTSGSNFGSTYAVPILDGHVIPYSCSRLPIGGNTFDNTLRNTLKHRYSFMENAPINIIRNIKESICYVAEHYAKEVALQNSVDYTLPDGQVIQLGEERFRCAEGLFTPSILDVESEGVHTLIHSTIMKSDEKFRKNLFANIVLDGGSTMFPGIKERLQKEIEKLNSSNNKVKVFAPPKRTEAVWRGGVLLANLPTFNNWVTSEEYSELGHKVVHKKCF